jgi:hypothetical protein
MRHGVALGHTERDGAADLGDVLAPVQSEKYAALTKPAEIAEHMKAIHLYGGDPSMCYCLRILSLVFTRPGELRNARWREFDLDGPEPLWRIPGERMKMQRKHPGDVWCRARPKRRPCSTSCERSPEPTHTACCFRGCWPASRYPMQPWGKSCAGSATVLSGSCRINSARRRCCSSSWCWVSLMAATPGGCTCMSV